MGVRTVLSVIFLTNWIHIGNGLDCYHCHQTSVECINGVRKYLGAVNCTKTDKCFVLKYATEMPGVTVLAAYRGCYNTPVHEMLKSVVTDKHRVVEKHFHLCNYTLCNNANVNKYVGAWE